MEINCPKCGEALELPEEAVGAKVKCPFCDEKFIGERPQEIVELSPIALSGRNCQGKSARGKISSGDEAMIEATKVVHKSFEDARQRVLDENFVFAPYVDNQVLERADPADQEVMYMLASFCEHGSNGHEKDYRKAEMLYRSSAELGCLEAMLKLGCMINSCKRETTGRRNDKEGADWFSKAAYSGLREAMYELASCYEEGVGVEESQSRAFEWYLKAAEAGHDISQNEVGERLFNGNGCPPDDSEAFRWFERAIDSDYSGAILNLAICYDLGRGVGHDQWRAAELYREYISRATFNIVREDDSLVNRQAYFNLGLLYYNGEIGSGDDVDDNKQAFALFSKAVTRGAMRRGNVSAMYYLGLCYWKGYGTAEDLRKAFYWFKEAADNGDDRAAVKVGYFYKNGYGCDRDVLQSFAFYKKAAEAGNSMGMWSCALCYERGTGTSVNLKHAYNWYLKGANAGDEDCMWAVGECYLRGDGVKENEREAFAWFKNSADEGSLDGKYNLARCYLYGWGVNKDRCKAEVLLIEARADGHEASAELLQKEFN